MSWAWLPPGPVSGRSHAVSGSPVVPVVSVSPVEVGPVSAVVASVVSVEVSAALVGSSMPVVLVGGPLVGAPVGSPVLDVVASVVSPVDGASGHPLPRRSTPSSRRCMSVQLKLRVMRRSG